MILVFETDNLKLVESAAQVVDSLDDLEIREASDEAFAEYEPGKFHIVSQVSVSEESLIPNAFFRHYWMSLAAKGARFYSESLDEENPVWAGPVPDDVDSLRRSIVDATNAQSRTEYYNSFGVHYVGRTKLDPRNLIVVSNDPENPGMSPLKNTALAALYSSMTPDWWGSAAVVSADTPELLEGFLMAIPDTILLAYETGIFSQLNFAGVDYARIPEPKIPDLGYGRDIREIANRLSYNLSTK